VYCVVLVCLVVCVTGLVIMCIAVWEPGYGAIPPIDLTVVVMIEGPGGVNVGVGRIMLTVGVGLGYLVVVVTVGR